MHLVDMEEREIVIDDQPGKIYGVAFIPEGKAPLVIYCHGLGGSYRHGLKYARELALHGLATYCFDFRCCGNQSDGDVTDMSVMTEVSDLDRVIEEAKTWDFVNEIILLGTSQGGIVASIAAARHVEDIAGLILCYPAFLVHDAVHQRFSTLEEVPASFQFEWVIAGKPYIEDMWDYDVYKEIGNYKKKVLLMHGDQDEIVPLKYSDQAAQVYVDVAYFVIKGSGHGFHGSAFEEAMAHIFWYLKEIGCL